MDEIGTIVSTGLDTVKGDVMSFLTIALPVALGIAGVFLAIRIGMKFFKSVSKT